MRIIEISLRFSNYSSSKFAKKTIPYLIILEFLQKVKHHVRIFIILAFTPRLQKYSNNSRPFAKHIVLFTTFAHKCELVGVSPEMIFRIADQKRDKKVGVAGLSEIMKRVKLKMDDV